MSYRPDGWRNPYGGYSEGMLEPTYEAGADAMLAALRKQDIREFSTLVGWVDGNPSGTLVYIPDAPLDAGPYYGNDGGTDGAIKVIPDGEAVSGAGSLMLLREIEYRIELLKQTLWHRGGHGGD